MTREQTAEYIKQQSPEAFLKRANKRGYVCPLCGNGSGADGDGIVKNPRDGRYYCFKCGEVRGDIFDLIGAAFGLTDFNSRYDKALEIYGLPAGDFAPIKGYEKNDGGSLPERTAKNRELSSGEETVGNASPGDMPRIGSAENNALSPADYGEMSDYIGKCHEKVRMTDYFFTRGIGEELVKKFRLGYDPAFSAGGGEVWEGVVFPTSEGSFEVRNINVPPGSKKHGKGKYRKRGRTAIFNLSAVIGQPDGNLPGTDGSDMSGDSAKPVFICEGVMDALSVMECGGEAAALGSAANRGLLLTELKKHGTSVPLVLLLDNDEAGKAAAARLTEELAAAGIVFTDGSEALGEFHDPNDRLVYDREGLSEAVKKLTERFSPLSEEIAAQQESSFLKVNAASCLADFKAQIVRNAGLPVCGTGFASLDRAINGGLYPGLYVLGAASSVGKTTLLLQIADHAAAAGRDVLFFSLEQSRFELMAKSVSRESFLYCRERHLNISSALSSLDISDGGRHSGFDDVKMLVMENAFGRYEKYAGRLFLYEGSAGMSPEDIAGEVRRFYAFRKPSAPPLVMVDYIQILSPGGGMMSDKQAMDRNITALKQLSRDYDIPLTAVSSFNRMSYSQSVSMEAFKESGAIEYGADILMGLQPRGVGQPGFDVTAAKARDPRRTELVILKNRSGAVPGEAVGFTYYPQFNCFMEG